MGDSLSLPSHWTHDNVCYPGSSATIQLHGLTMGATSVPEPGALPLIVLALILCLLFARIRTRGGTKLG